MSEDDKNDLPLGWKKAQIVASILSSFLIPIVVAIVGGFINDNINRSELSLKYINIATEILKLNNQRDNQALRKWAVEIVNEYAKVKMKDDAQVEAVAVGITNPPSVIYGAATETDFSIFSCQDTPADKALANNVIIQLASEKKHGQIDYKGVFVDKTGTLTIEKLKGAFTIILDKNHPEKQELNRITGILRKVSDTLPINQADNNNNPDPWRIGIVACSK